MNSGTRNSGLKCMRKKNPTSVEAMCPSTAFWATWVFLFCKLQVVCSKVKQLLLNRDLCPKEGQLCRHQGRDGGYFYFNILYAQNFRGLFLLCLLRVSSLCDGCSVGTEHEHTLICNLRHLQITQSVSYECYVNSCLGNDGNCLGTDEFQVFSGYPVEAMSVACVL